MAINLPERILNSRIGASAPTGELLTLGRLFSEIADYASTVLSRSYSDTARTCNSRLRRVRKELQRRGVACDFQIVPVADCDVPDDLRALSIDELERLYRQRPVRLERRLADRREHLTRYEESRIVAELGRRMPANRAEQLKVDYCLLTHKAAMENLASILGLPSGNRKDNSDLAELTAEQYVDIIERYKSPRTVAERETVVEAVDRSIALIDSAEEIQGVAWLAAELAELDRLDIARCPKRVIELLRKAVKNWTRRPAVAEAEMAVPLLTLSLIDDDPKLERKAQRIIRRSYLACVAGTASPSDRLVVSLCPSYLPRHAKDPEAISFC